MKTIIIIIIVILAGAGLWFHNHSKDSALAKVQSRLKYIYEDRERAQQELADTQLKLAQAQQELAGFRTKTVPTPWYIPRNLTTTNGKVYRNVTIRGVATDGGIIINFGPNAIKLPNGSLGPKDIEDIISATPAAAPVSGRNSGVPRSNADSPPVTRLQSIGGG